ncbi:MAG: DUF4965 domain-containing protein [Fimbriimonadaceae bacterium]|nr:DUF4965 domain-containing protein [Fimbriimonadaceae bacterium]
MTPITTCVARLGSRFSLQLDPIRKHVLYGAVGLFHQRQSELLVELRDAGGVTAALPLAGERPGFDLLSQRQTMTRVVWDAYSQQTDAKVEVELLAPFLPRDVRMSVAPLYLLHVKVSRLKHRLRWQGPRAEAAGRGVVQVALRVPDVATTVTADAITFTYETPIQTRRTTGEGGIDRANDPTARQHAADLAHCQGAVAVVTGDWQQVDDGFELSYDLRSDTAEGWLALTGWFDDACFEGHRVAGPLKYVPVFAAPDAVLAYARSERERIVAAADFVDGLILDSSLPRSLQDLIAFSFQSYLSCTVWAELAGRDWFSVWEGSCWYNSTVDVEYNNGLVYWGLWPQLLESIFEQWTGHLRPVEQGAWLEHDMGSGWTSNGQAYHHPMEVEENANWLLLLYAHGVWWGREELFEQHAATSRLLAEYLLAADTTGNGFPDQGTANTIDDATPAVQYGRDQVYLGVKRLAALHAAGRMGEAVGDQQLADRCYEAVDLACATLQEGWLGDHYPVCLDRSTTGLVDAWTHQPLPYDELPGWDAYSLYTTNGLLYLFMVDDLPSGLDPELLRIDLLSAYRASLTEYGCTHCSADPDHLWVSMNLWRDQAGCYLGENLLATADRYWQMQIAANAGTEAKCFVDTNYTNNLCNYPRGIASLGALWAAAGLRVRARDQVLGIAPPAPCRVPLLTHVDWANLRAPWLDARPDGDGLEWTIDNEDLLAGWDILPLV